MDSLSTRRRGLLASLAWIADVLASAGGIAVSFKYDLPTGPVVVCVFGLLLLAAFLLRRMLPAGAPATD